MPLTRRLLIPALLALLAYASTSRAESHDSRPRFFFNDDGDRPWLYRGPFHVRQLHDAVDGLLRTGVTTLCYCACTGSDQAYYPSKVVSTHDWRKTPSHEKGVFNRLYRLAGLWREQRLDVLGTVRDRAREKGLEFVPSLRM